MSGQGPAATFGRTYLMRELGETSWYGPFGPCRDITAAALLFARLKRLKTGQSITIEIGTGSRDVQEVRVERAADEDGGLGYTVEMDVL